MNFTDPVCAYLMIGGRGDIRCCFAEGSPAEIHPVCHETYMNINEILHGKVIGIWYYHYGGFSQTRECSEAS